ncbi:N(4)-acetylcytidine aminohydrolase [Shewanella acanthi]|uniref:N(4)-acetylcytidine aminohydrolase n=1 Tax=Shewanella acanthi TaxID=2864212 RepID=UPI001C658A2D|nr:N(4)-acetylcytidine aminohydrolase [Shewanella acanthi]QYJ80577.1 N(4)-acetylcytidine aminohydrolase [Shewanella acanthi]
MTFFERFETDILSGAKTITLRDEAESSFEAGQIVAVSTFEDDRWFCDIEILSVTPLKFYELNDEHAQQENMSLAELHQVISEIYPKVEQLFLIQFYVTKKQ